MIDEIGDLVCFSLTVCSPPGLRSSEAHIHLFAMIWNRLGPSRNQTDNKVESGT